MNPPSFSNFFTSLCLLLAILSACAAAAAGEEEYSQNMLSTIEYCGEYCAYTETLRNITWQNTSFPANNTTRLGNFTTQKTLSRTLLNRTLWGIPVHLPVKIRFLVAGGKELKLSLDLLCYRTGSSFSSGALYRTTLTIQNNTTYTGTLAELFDIQTQNDTTFAMQLLLNTLAQNGTYYTSRAIVFPNTQVTGTVVLENVTTGLWDGNATQTLSVKKVITLHRTQTYQYAYTVVFHSSLAAYPQPLVGQQAAIELFAAGSITLGGLIILAVWARALGFPDSGGRRY